MPYTLKPASDCLGVTKFYEEPDGGLNGDNTTVTFSEPSSMIQGKPYVFEQKSANDDGTYAPQSQFGITGFVAFALSDPTEIAAMSPSDGTYLKGTFEAKSDATNAYVLDEDGAFVKSGSVDANTAYLNFSSDDMAMLAADFGGFSTTLAVTSDTDDSGNATLSVSIPIAGLPSYTTSADKATHSLMPAMDTDDSGNTTYIFNITDGDYTSFSTQAVSKTVNLHYTRTFTKAENAPGWYSWLTPFEFTLTTALIGDETTTGKAKFYYPVVIMPANESSEDWLLGVVKMKEGETVKANWPYFIKPAVADRTTTELKFNITNASLAATASNTLDLSNLLYTVNLIGNYSNNKYFEVGQWSLGSDGSGFNEFDEEAKTNYGDVNIAPLRFYMTLTAKDNPYTSTSTKSTNARISIVEFDDEATAIQAVNKAVERGSGKVYDLQGRRVTKPVRGIYIMDGKKVLVK